MTPCYLNINIALVLQSCHVSGSPWRVAYLAEGGEPGLVSGGAAPVGRVLEVKVEAVEVPCPQEVDAGPHELVSIGPSGQHRRHRGRAEVPPPNG